MGPTQGGLLPMFGLGTLLSGSGGPKNWVPVDVQPKPCVVCLGLEDAAGRMFQGL